MKDTLPVRVRLGEFELDLKAGELLRLDGAEPTVRTVLPHQPLRLLLMLVEREGEVATREEIQKRLWPNDTVVEFEHSINAAIAKLRKAFGDTANEPRYIETLAKRGYRLMVPVEWAKAGDEPSSGEVRSNDGAATRVQPAVGALAGRTVSHYRVLDIIGGGGMGVVYRAEDLKLGRRVALKFLPEELSSDPQALERFSREAHAASSLDHLNICHIYEFGEHEGRPFMVMQLLEGQTLRDRLANAAEGNALPLNDLLDIGIQVSDGLQAAHEKGIIHRDIKPANIFITTKGVCKILDFGLVKLLEGGEEDEVARRQDGPFANPPAVPEAMQLTRTGIALGTAGYMSPEQVRGEKLDARTDLFSFGLVLYEMATGHRAFSGETAAVVHDAILNRAPFPARQLNPEVSPGLEAVINKALEKDRRARYQTAAEMGADLKRLHRGAESPLPTSMQRPRRYGRAMLVGAALAIVLLVLGLALRWFKGRQIASGRMLSERQLTHNPEENPLHAAAISPDGKHMAYLDTKGLSLSVVETGEIHDVPLPEELRTHLSDVTWLPDGENLILTSGSLADGATIWLTSVFGGVPRKLGNGWFPAASPQGTQIAFVGGDNHEIWVMGADGANPHRILIGENDTYSYLAWSPTGQRLAYIKRERGGEDRSIETVSLDKGLPSVVLSDTQEKIGLLWARDGRMIFVWADGFGTSSGGNLWEIMTDPGTGKPSGSAKQMTNWGATLPFSATLSRDANRLAVVKEHSRDDVYVGELKDGGRRLASPTRLTVSQSWDIPSGWMHDSKTILFSSNRTGRVQVFRQELDQETAEPLIPGPDDKNSAGMSPDGRWVLYWASAYSGGGPPPTTTWLMRFPVSGGSPEKILETQLPDPTDFHCPSGPAVSCVLSRWEHGQCVFYALDPVQGQGKELARSKMGPVGDYWGVSPDGLRIAVPILDQRPEQVRILDSRNGTERNFQLPQGWSVGSLSWTADGDALYADAHQSTGYVIARIELDGTVHALLNRERHKRLSSPLPSPDGRHLAFNQQTSENNAWLLENF